MVNWMWRRLFKANEQRFDAFKTTEAEARSIAKSSAAEQGLFWSGPVEAQAARDGERRVWYVRSNATGRGHSVSVRIDDETRRVEGHHVLPQVGHRSGSDPTHIRSTSACLAVVEARGIVLGMATTKVTVTLDDAQLASVRRLVAQRKAESISGFVKHAVSVALADVAGWGALLGAALEETGGALTAKERAWADSVLQPAKANDRASRAGKRTR